MDQDNSIGSLEPPRQRKAKGRKRLGEGRRGEEGRGSLERRVRWGNMRLTTASGPGLTTDFLKRPQNCEIGLSEPQGLLALFITHYNYRVSMIIPI